MHYIRPKFIITKGEHFLPDKLIHKQIAKFYCIKFEGKVYEIQFFFLRVSIKFKIPRKKFLEAALLGGI